MQQPQVLVRFTKRYSVYNKGEIAGFNPNLAARLIRAEGAVSISAPDGWDPDKELEITRERPRGADEETKMRRLRVRLAFDACPQSGRDRNGKPTLDAMAHITGQALLQDDLDHAWDDQQASKKLVAEMQHEEDKAQAARNDAKQPKRGAA